MGRGWVLPIVEGMLQKSDGEVKIVLSTPQLPAFARTRLIRRTIPS
jgi:hypothetical protein